MPRKADDIRVRLTGWVSHSPGNLGPKTFVLSNHDGRTLAVFARSNPLPSVRSKVTVSGSLRINSIGKAYLFMTSRDSWAEIEKRERAVEVA